MGIREGCYGEAGSVARKARQKILQAFDQARPPILPTPTAEPMRPQEQRVLALLRAGLFYSDITGQRIVSVSYYHYPGQKYLPKTQRK